ncbi:MscS Mechanosensitive ion channel [[Leptolyngbya] sp. PCC 7376]|uniref:mechanosensitive ion channel family protein n=1 Tax=[Leptolyngbya] sp. PCC 7376 TaxID=111781 RepID=UPI00029F2E34|nr:mechanosensitive ion channel domain-containing protein [[Leptolyngbya] sp. PCC 7376]AFY36565.1 MscS Mechanosensitive ion channel [[Leptolyngbya] sp. PCC 7376]
MQNSIDLIIQFLTTFGIRLITALLILFIGLQTARWVKKSVRSLLIKTRLDSTLTSFAVNLSYVAFIVLVIVAVLERVGVQTTSFLTVLGAAGLAIGLALQGSLTNFASGVLIIIFRPFSVDDLVVIAGSTGFVEDISFLTTTIRMPDNQTVIIPNSAIYADKIINISLKQKIRVDLIFGVGYEADIDQTKQILREIAEADKRILSEPTPQIELSELADSSVNFTMRVWIKSKDYLTIHFGLTETVKKRFDAAGVSIPFPQRDVHLYSTN